MPASAAVPPASAPSRATGSRGSRIAGTYGEAWKRDRDPLPPRTSTGGLPVRARGPADPAAAGRLRGRAPGNFTSDGFLQFLLPRVTFDIVTQFYRRAGPAAGGSIHSLLIRPDERRFVIVWHSALACPYDEERLKGTVIRARRRVNVRRVGHRTGVWVAEPCPPGEPVVVLGVGARTPVGFTAPASAAACAPASR